MDDDRAFSPTTRSVVVGRLRDEILSGRMSYGTRLRQAEVAQRFGISTTPVREAFRELATLGLVEILPHRGAVVLRPTGEELTQIYEARMLLEPVSVAWSAQRITDGELDEARKLIELMEVAESADAAAMLNRRFHAVLAHACGNQHVGELVVNLLDRSTPYFVRVMEKDHARAAGQRSEHEEILTACAAGDPQRAYEASLKHLTKLHLGTTAESDDRVEPSFEARWLPFDLRAWIAAANRPLRKPRQRKRT